jgi:hypothetical protein
MIDDDDEGDGDSSDNAELSSAMDAVESPTLISSSSGWFIIVIFHGFKGRGGDVPIVISTNYHLPESGGIIRR